MSDLIALAHRVSNTQYKRNWLSHSATVPQSQQMVKILMDHFLWLVLLLSNWREIFESVNVGAFTISDWTVCHHVGPSKERLIWFMRNICGWIGNCKPTEWYLNLNLIALHTHTHKPFTEWTWMKSYICAHLNWCSRFKIARHTPPDTTAYYMLYISCL